MDYLVDVGKYSCIDDQLEANKKDDNSEEKEFRLDKDN